MEFFTVIGALLITYYLCFIILLCFVDCDLALSFYQFFGKPLSKLNGKVVWITGASSGIGEAMAYEVAKNGGKLILSARRTDSLTLVRNRCFELNPQLTQKDILLLPLDVTKFETHQMCVNTTLNHFGQIDILINNAGRSQRAVWEDIHLDVDKQMFDLNVFGVISLSRLVIKHFNTRGKGKIVVNSSIAGIIGVPLLGSYSGSKFAIHGYFESLRTEKIGTNVHVTLLCPGPVFSNILNESFTANPDEKYGVSVKPTDRRMTAERCAKLSLIAIVNKLDSAWMALFPIVPLVYARVYFPNFSRLIAKHLGGRRFQRLRDSWDTMASPAAATS